MKVSILIPCHNEEKTIEACIQSCLLQTRQADEIIVVDDASTDKSVKILRKFKDKIKIISLKKRRGNKSYVQEVGIEHITGDIFVTTDADTVMDPHCVEEILKEFKKKGVFAAAGYVKSLKHNWLTACRELDYIIGQDLHKYAQSILNTVLVVPGCASAFRTKQFKRRIKFDHDTLTEDLDITYKIHLKNMKIAYSKTAITYTQDPGTITSYVNQMRRWYCGGWQNLMKHYRIFTRANTGFEATLMYAEGFTSSFVLLILPFLSISLYLKVILFYYLYAFMLGIYGSIRRKRPDLLLCTVFYPVVGTINAAIFLEQFIKEVIFKKKNLSWYQPKRRAIA